MGDRVIFRGVVEIPDHRLDENAIEIMTAEAKKGSTTPGKARKLQIYRETESGRVLVPKYLYLSKLVREGDTITIQERPLAKSGFVFHGTFWQEQKDGVDNLVTTLSKYHGALGKGRCGTGKTVIGAYLLSRVRSSRSAVLVDQTNLAEQWATQIRDHLPGTSISFIMDAGKQKEIYERLGMTVPSPLISFDTRGQVIIASAQSVMQRNLLDDPIQVTFLIVDEAHTFSAPRFMDSVFNFSFRYSCALTATDERRDGLDWIFKNVLGTKMVQLSGKRMNPSVVGVHTPTSDTIRVDDHKMVWCNKHHMISTKHKCRLNCPTSDYIPRDRGFGCANGRFTGNIHFTEMTLRLTADRTYNASLAKLIALAAKTDHQIIVFSRYKEHLKTLRSLTIAEGIEESDTSLYFGGMERTSSLKPRITFATFGVAQKGLDAPWKDVAVIASPVTSVEQTAGRIERVMKGKPNPTILDPIVSSSIFMNQWEARRKYYEGAGYDIRTGSLEEAGVALREAHKNCWEG